MAYVKILSWYLSHKTSAEAQNQLGNLLSPLGEIDPPKESVIQEKLKKGRKPATINRYLALMRGLLHMARDEWQWIDSFPKIRLLPGETERDRWLTQEETEKLIAVCSPDLAALVCFALLATGHRAREIAGLE